MKLNSKKTMTLISKSNKYILNYFPLLYFMPKLYDRIIPELVDY